MKFIGFNFTKISVEKLSGSLDNLKINTKIDISQIKPAKTDFSNKNEEIIFVKFTYDIDYDTNYAKIELAGDIFLSDEPDTIKKILKEWNDDQKMSEEFRIFLFNTILRKSNLKALQLEDEMNLPLHIPFPSLKKENLADTDSNETIAETKDSTKEDNASENIEDNSTSNQEDNSIEESK